jgi:class 3 adenylate cyclase
MPRKRRRDRPEEAEDDLGEDIARMVQASIRERMLRKVAKTPLPDGVVTIVFTDVEGSSELVRDLGDHEAHPILRRHDEVVRAVLAEHEGIEVERSGDAFMLVFRFPSKAVSFAVALHDRLATDAEVRVRIGMDTGEVIREEKGYFGRTVFRAARIAEMGKGGQIMASEATKVLAESIPKVRFVDLGERELDGLGDDHRVFEVLPPAATEDGLGRE